MPSHIRRHVTNASLSPIATINLSTVIRNASRNNHWNPQTQQRVFDYAMTLYHRRNATLENRRLARGALHRLVHNHNRTWGINPRAARFRNNGYISELNSIFNSNRNNNGSNNNSNNRATAARKIQNAFRAYRTRRAMKHARTRAPANLVLQKAMSPKRIMYLYRTYGPNSLRHFT